MIDMTPKERILYAIVCALWRAWRAPAVLADIELHEGAEKEAIRKRLQSLNEKGWIQVGTTRRERGIGWVPTYRALAVERIDEIMALVTRVANASYDEDRIGNAMMAMNLIQEIGWAEASPTNPTVR